MIDVIVCKDYCKGCSYCVHFCPKECLSLGSQLNSKGFYFPVFENQDECTGCGACAKLCPDFAIEVYKD